MTTPISVILVVGTGEQVDIARDEAEGDDDRMAKNIAGGESERTRVHSVVAIGGECSRRHMIA